MDRHAIMIQMSGQNKKEHKHVLEHCLLHSSTNNRTLAVIVLLVYILYLFY